MRIALVEPLRGLVSADSSAALGMTTLRVGIISQVKGVLAPVYTRKKTPKIAHIS